MPRPWNAIDWDEPRPSLRDLIDSWQFIDWSPVPIQSAALDTYLREVGEKYVHVPTYECLDYTRFDGRLWKLEGGEVKGPMDGSTFALLSPDQATYTTPDGKHAKYRVADPASLDPETFSCPT